MNNKTTAYFIKNTEDKQLCSTIGINKKNGLLVNVIFNKLMIPNKLGESVIAC